MQSSHARTGIFRLKITSPKTEEDFKKYFHLRWKILRAPWGEAKGTEQDEHEDASFHVMVVNNDEVIGVARLQNLEPGQAQIRYMAVSDEYQNQGIGQKIIGHIEQYARNNNIEKIILHAREPAVSFYEKLGYKNIEKSYLLFDCIQHYKMKKSL